jgi:hypothetical protein
MGASTEPFWRVAAAASFLSFWCKLVCVWCLVGAFRSIRGVVDEPFQRNNNPLKIQTRRIPIDTLCYYFQVSQLAK